MDNGDSVCPFSQLSGDPIYQVVADPGETYSTEDTAALLRRLSKQLAMLEAAFKEHLRASRQACLQEVASIENYLDVQPKTSELRDIVRKGFSTDRGT